MGSDHSRLLQQHPYQLGTTVASGKAVKKIRELDQWLYGSNKLTLFSGEFFRRGPLFDNHCSAAEEKHGISAVVEDQLQSHR